jgi:hypothetical protein
MKAQEWIDRYVYAVGEALPLQERDDVQAEIRSLIQDELDARQPSGAAEVDETTVLAVLEQFGRPETLAARYHAPRSLIGPVLYPIFRIVSTIVLTVLVGVWVFGVAVDVGMYQRPLTNPLEMFGDLVGSLFQTFGTIVIVFALIETFARAELEAERKQEPWDPRSLPKVEDTERPKIGELVVGIGFNLAAILIFNAYPDWISAIMLTGGEVVRTPLLSENFMRFVPWLSLLWGAGIVINAFVLIRGSWQPLSRWLQIGLEILTLALLAWMLVGGPLLAWTALEPVATLIVSIVLAVATIDVVVQIFRQIRRQRSAL